MENCSLFFNLYKISFGIVPLNGHVQGVFLILGVYSCSSHLAFKILGCNSWALELRSASRCQEFQHHRRDAPVGTEPSQHELFGFRSAASLENLGFFYAARTMRTDQKGCGFNSTFTNPGLKEIKYTCHCRSPSFIFSQNYSLAFAVKTLKIACFVSRLLGPQGQTCFVWDGPSRKH